MSAPLILLAAALATVCVGAAALAAEKPAPADITANFKFRDIGPAAAGGRVTVVAGVPGNPNVIYVGAAAGGVWKSTDGGDTWKAVLSHSDSASIGALALAPSNPNLVWVGTGESNVRNDTITGAGVYYSPDAGKTWEFKGLKDAGQISAIVIDPKNPAIVFVAAQGDPWGPNADRGVFRTTDGGKTWQKVLFVDDKTGASSLMMEPGNPQVLFAGMWTALRTPWTMINGSATGGVWRSTDGGVTWTKLTEGLPTGDTGRITLAAAPSNPEHIYALIPTKSGTLWSSEDLGEHWTMVSNNHALAVRQWYFAGMAVAPNDQNRVYFASLNLMESDDGGKTAHAIDKSVHVDHHAVWVDPDNPARILQGNDGGVYLSVNSGKNWRFLDTLPIEQAYTVSVDNQSPFHACVGLQDNDAWCGPTSSLDEGAVTGKHWVDIPAGDGQYVVIAPSDPDIVYSDGEDGYATRTDLRTHLSTFIRPNASYGLQNTPKTLAESKYRFNWTSPIAVSPTDANTVYLGAQVLFKSTDDGQSWTIISPDLTRNDKSKQGIPGSPVYHDVSSAENYDTLLSITLAPTDPGNVIWVGSDDGLVHVTRDDGAHWKNVTPHGAPEWARVYQIGVSPFDAGTAYVSFDAHLVNDDQAYVYRTTDYGQSWTRITDGLPAHTPVLVVREDPNRKGLLIAGTMTGLYYSLNDGNQWQPLTGNFPTVPVFDLQFAPATHALAVATHGRGLFVLDNLRPLEEWNDQITGSAFHLFTPQPGTLYNTWSSDEGQQWRYTVPNAPAGVVFSYWIKNALKSAGKDKQGPVKIVIKDAAGNIINTLHAPGKTGLNEFTWDMNYAGPTKIDFLKGAGGGQGGGGPSVMPGTYTASFSVNGHDQTQQISVRLDPNIQVNVADYRAQLLLALGLRNQMSAANELLNRLTAWQQQLDALTNAPSEHPAPQAVLDDAKTLNGKIAKLKDQLWNPHIQHNVGEDFLKYLPRFHTVLQFNSAFLGGYAQRPAPYVGEKYAELREELQGYLDQFNQLLSQDVPAYNRAAYAAGDATLATGKPIVYLKPDLPTP
ncbi:MAG: WD40/YVTN/BNR-like repeat-containing protein [Gammaproteobacteria bacterium]